MILVGATPKAPLLSLIGAFLVGGSAVTARAEPRVFTNKDGREIIAEIVHAKGDTVRLEKDGKTFNSPISLFSPEDQAFIRKWMADHPAAVDYNFSFKVTKKKIGRTSRPSGYWQRRESTWSYTVMIENRSRDLASGLTVEYRIFKEDKVRTDYPRTPPEIEEKKGAIKLPDLKTHHEAELTTETFVLEEISWDTSSDYTDAMIGILIRVVDSKGTPVAEFKEGNLEITRRSWADSKKKKNGATIKTG